MTRAVHIAGGEILTPDGLQPGTVTIADGAIQSITDPFTERQDAINGAGLIVSPGFIDLQINGGFGHDLATDPDAMWELGRRLPRYGVTTFLPTIISGPPATTAATLDAFRRRPLDYLGAEPVGAHFEGPMLSPQQPGVHPTEHLVPPSLRVIDRWSAGNGVALVTIAPELPGATKIITELAGRGVTVAAGHSNATEHQARAGLAAGITMVTHLFNAMAPLDHRRPNLVGLALAAEELTVGLIVDGIHLDPCVVAATWKAKRPKGIVLVTDAVAPMGHGPGRYEFAGTTVTADECCVRNEAGALAGSILTMDQAVRNLIAYTGCPTSCALEAASTTPATVIGETVRGRVQPGAIADLVLLDQNLHVQATICAGRLAYVADSARHRIPAPHTEGV